MRSRQRRRAKIEYTRLARMLFNSFVFLAFFAAVYFVYWGLSGAARRHFLIAASIVFYAAWGLQSEGWWGLRWAAHFLFMVGVNYAFTRFILNAATARAKNRYLKIIVIFDLLNLGIFKYFVFLRAILTDLGVDMPDAVEELGWFLPLAISFYTFQLVAYVVDVYRGKIDRDHGPARFFLFILFFPQLIAGPIMRSEDFMAQLDHPVIDQRRMYDGLWLILGGLVKKVVLADPMGVIVAPVFGAPHTYDAWSLFLAAACFSLQVYCDFSGYTDIARGVSNLLGYEIPENFRAPYFARSARELWQRWHITLTTWLRDYIYIPLGGNRLGTGRTYFNLEVTFTLGGLWHGADYTYVAWGAFWGVLLAVERFVEDDLGINTTPKKNRVLIVLKVAFMFFLFCLGAIMFRSQPLRYVDGLTGQTIDYSAARVMIDYLAGLITNMPGRVLAEFTAAGGDAAFATNVFGSDVFRMNALSNWEPILVMFLGLGFFHLIQYRQGLFDAWRKYDPYLLVICGAIVCGVIMPAIAVGSHSFIYFVF